MKVIVECSKQDKILKQLGTVVYELPLINSYVLEINATHIEKFKKMKNITYHQATKITAQQCNAKWCM